MAGSQGGFYWKQDTLFRNVKTLAPKLERAIIAATEYGATRGESYMRSTAPWTDRTGAARGGLFTATEHGSTYHKIIFSHSVPYGIWLEVRWSGRYAVIMPSVEHTGREVMALLGGLLGRVGT